MEARRKFDQDFREGAVRLVGDNAAIESWHFTLEFELRSLEHFATRAQARGPDRGVGR